MSKKLFSTILVGLLAIGLPIEMFGQLTSDATNSNIYLNDAAYKLFLNNTSYSAGPLTYKLEVRGTFRSSSTVRATQFLDDDNTGYLLDPTGTSNLNGLKAVSLVDGDNNGYVVDPSGTSILNAVTVGSISISSGVTGATQFSKVAINQAPDPFDATQLRVTGGIGLNQTGTLMFGNLSFPMAGLLSDNSYNITLRGGSVDGVNGGGVSILGGGCADCSNGGHVTIDPGRGGSGYIDGNIYLAPQFGDVRVGYSGGSTPAAKLDVNGSVRATSYVTVSDGTLKSNIKQISGGLNMVLKLQGTTYTFKSDAKSPYHLPKGPQIGFIAQDVEKVLPDAVFTDANGVKGVDYNKIVPVLVEAVKELQLQIETLKAEIISSTNASTNAPNEEHFKSIELYQNHPNPFDKNTTISYKLVDGISTAGVYIFDMQGKEIKRVSVPLDSKSIEIQAGELGAGMYIYSLIVDGKEVDTKRMILTR